MMRRESLVLLLGLVACGEQQRPPAVVLVSIDMLRADHVSAYGYGKQTTPTLDALAAGGVRFARHVSSAPWTLPAHTALFTSLPDSVHGVVAGSGNALADEVTTLAERFQAAGYATAGFYAGPYLHSVFGLGQGFDLWQYCVPEAAAQFSPENVDLWAADPAAQRRSHHGVTNPLVFEAASAWLGAHREQPFFLFVHLWDAHFDFVPPKPYDARFTDPAYQGFVDGREFFFDRRIGPAMDPRDLTQLLALYDGEILWCDAHLKRLRERLMELGLFEDTIFVVTSDHGTEFFDHGQKGHRRTLYGEVLQVPLVIHAPGRLPAGAVLDEVTRTIDVAPTLLALAGLAGDPLLMGENLLPRLGQALPPLPAISELLADGNDLVSLTHQHSRIVWNRKNGGLLWFDLVQDPLERTPRTEFESGRGAELAALLAHEVRRLETAAQQRGLRPTSANLPPALQAALNASGYGGED